MECITEKIIDPTTVLSTNLQFKLYAVLQKKKKKSVAKLFTTLFCFSLRQITVTIATRSCVYERLALYIIRSYYYFCANTSMRINTGLAQPILAQSQRTPRRWGMTRRRRNSISFLLFFIFLFFFFRDDIRVRVCSKPSPRKTNICEQWINKPEHNTAGH